MALYILSDLHLSFSSEKPMDVFGPRWRDHTTKIRYAWNAIVKESDTVIVSGDFSWAMTLEESKEDFLFLDSLKGKKILLKGNHDYWWNSKTKVENFLQSLGIDNVTLLQNNSIVCEDFIICGTRGWYSDKDFSPANSDYKAVMAREVERMKLSLASGESEKEKPENSGKEMIAVTHFPPYFDNFVFKDLISVIESHGIKRIYYGHIHSIYNIPRTMTLGNLSFTITSADYLNFTPLIIKPEEK